MFGRGLDEKKRKRRIRRVGGGGRKVKADGTTTAAKVKKSFNFLFFSNSFSNDNRIDTTKTLRSHCFCIR